MSSATALKITVVTLFPQMIQDFLRWGVLGQAIEKKLIEVVTVNPRDFTSDTHRTVDDRPFGGGDGMVMLADPLISALRTVGEEKGSVIYLSPQGSTLDDTKVRELSRRSELILICGRYGGIDQRFLNEWVDEELSIGDYVLSGGEAAAMVLIDAVSRQIPGVLGHADSASQDSFAQGWLEAPHFTRPRGEADQAVPEALLSGHHQNIQRWRLQVGQLVTLLKRPDLFARQRLSARETQKLKEFWRALSAHEVEILGLQSLGEKDFESVMRSNP